MKSQESQKGQVSSPAAEPKDKPNSKKEKYLQEAKVCVLKELFPYNARFRHEVLTAALEEVSKTLKPAGELLAMEERVRKICDGLDIKTKAVISVLGELACIEGYTIGVEYGSDILHDELRSKVFVDEACKQLPDDPDLACLAKVYELAKSVSETEDNREVSGTKKQAEEELVEEGPHTTDQPEEDAETQEESEKESYGFNPKERVQAYEVFKQYMNTRTLEEKQAALALSMLLSKQQYLPDEQIGDRLYKQWRDEVLALGSLDQLQLKGVPGNEAFCQGYLTAMIIMDG